MKKSAQSRFFHYIKARFPVVPLFLYALVTQIGIASVTESKNIFSLIYLTFLYVLFLFHLRILDEFKDHVFDSKHYPHRPVQKGIVSLNELKYVGIINIGVVLLLGYLTTNSFPILLLFISLLYTALMFQEFHLRTFLKKHILVYLLSHEVVFIPLFLFFFTAQNQEYLVPIIFSNVTAVLYFILPIILIEIGRKIQHRHNAKGIATDDTYAYHWGERNTIFVFSSLFATSALLGFISGIVQPYLTIVLLVTALILAAMGILHTKQVVRYSMSITTFFALLLPLLPLL